MYPTYSFDPSKMKAAAKDYFSSDSDDEDDEDEYLMPSTNPNADEFADYKPRKRRRTGRDGRDAKESAALGIFGSESEDDGPDRRWKTKNLRTKGLTFVSTDNAQDASGHEEVADDDRGDESDEDEDDKDSFFLRDVGNKHEDDGGDHVPAIGLDFGASTGNGFARAHSSQQNTSLACGATKANPLGQGFVPSSANEPVLESEADMPTRPQKALPSAFSSHRGKPKINQNSFGARMMAKMGYVQGQGLGKEGQGRTVAVEANLRRQGLGLGAVKEKSKQEREEEKRQAKRRGEVIVDSDEEEKRKRAERKKQSRAGTFKSGSGSAAGTPRRQKAKFMTIDEVKKAAPGLDIPDAFTPILDLTGPQRRMLTSSSGLMTPTPVTTDNDQEVQGKKLVRRAQNDFMAILEEWQALQERKAFTELQLQQESQELDGLVTAVEAHRSIAAVLDELTQLDHTAEEGDELLLGGSDQAKQRWDRVISLLRRTDELTSDLTIQQVKDEMASIAVAAIRPIMKDMVDNWNPLESARAQYASDLESIKGLLGVDKSGAVPYARSSASPYESMMYTLWLPRVSRSVREWNVRDAEPLTAVIEAWRSVLPGFLKIQLLEQDIIRVLEEAIAKWEPKRTKSQNLPHLWLFPWFQYLPDRHLDAKSSTGLVADVKRKYRQLIDVWEFDRGVIPGLKEWKNILRSKHCDQWQPLVMNHLLPSMARYLGKYFDVDPSDQKLEILMGVFEWLDLLSPATIAEVIVAAVFPKWHETLYQWLVMETVDYNDVSQWCEWWHDEALAGIEDTPSIATEFETALRTIEHALDLFDMNEDPKTTLPPPGQFPACALLTTAKTTGGHHQQHKHQQQHGREDKPNSSPFKPTRKELERSFRCVVEDWCQANDLQFIPERKRVHSEGLLYRLTDRLNGRGGVLTYLKGNTICLQTKNGEEEFTGDPGSSSDWERLIMYASTK